ncbi:MAG: methyltransferase domain-containing protein [Bacteroidales bacterium]|nr:MAG: methyltransferase domain-containing protein [Bacteroidales bacterium]
MSIVARTSNFFVSLVTSERFYRMMNLFYIRFHNEYYMLHYPFFENEEDDLIQSQKNLTNHCLSKISPVKGKVVLDVGCGNGIQGLHITEDHGPEKYIGIDILPENIRIANQLIGENDNDNMVFHIDNAQDLVNIRDNSVDVVINIESALHYPNKMRFLKEIYRVLKPGGEFLIADVLTTKKPSGKKNNKQNRWGIFHHWTLEEYLNSFPFADLKLISTHDISQSVLQGFRNYKNWFRKKKSKNLLYHLISHFLVFINAKVYSHMYVRTRSYYVFTGVKPIPGPKFLT